MNETYSTASMPASEITAVNPPEYLYDGTRGVFYFKTMPQAAYYDIYLSLNKDGSQAIRMGSRLRKTGSLISGFLADTDFYAFVVYYSRDGKNSRVSRPFHFRLKDNFSNK